ncbi:MAG: SH3 domain-containing protein [Firmicutes bacterium]|nr:SH3 domain-containing protein [Bacillota bacterium]
MNYRNVKATAYVLAAAITFSGVGLTAEASVMPSGGIGLVLANGNKLENVTEQTAIPIESIVEWIHIDDDDAAEQGSEELTEEDLFRNLVIAQVRAYVNVRSIPSEEGEIVGKLYNNSVGTFISEENGWYQIQSGSVTGYVKGEYCVTGEEAVDIARSVGTRIATVNTQTLFVRKEPTTESSILGMVPMADELLVLEETEGWVKVDVEEGTGWVSADYVELHSEFVQAESKAEEEARLAKEAAERKKAQDAARAKAERNTNKETNTSENSQPATTYAVGEGSEMGVAVAEYALQFVGNPYVYGGTSLTNGADCSGFVMSVYANFGVSLPHSSASDRSQGYAVDGLENAQPGDLICYSGHVALYIGNGQIVHASNKRTGIIVSQANYRKILAIRRIF